jgi:histidinol phosphatase-like enzyme
MDNEFSWMQIHPEGDSYSLYMYNKNGLKKKVFRSHDLETVQNAMKRRQENKENQQFDCVIWGIHI